jgi:site-specific recombinase XerD
MGNHCEQGRLFDAGIDIGRLRETGEALRSVGRAPMTVRAYRYDLNTFARWCGDSGREALPCTEDTLFCYVTWLLSDERRRATTATRHVAAILHAHRVGKHPMPSTVKAREAIAGHRRVHREVAQGKLALTPDELLSVAEACDTATNLGLRDRALVVTGFASTLRRSELAALRLSDVGFNKNGLAILVRRSKTDQEGKSRLQPVWAGERESTDPVRTLRAWIERRGLWDGPLFVRVRRGDVITTEGIGGESVCDSVKRAIKRAGIAPEKYGAHSLRAGAATASAELGRSDQEIMRMTGHKTAAAMQMYVRSARLFTGRNPLAGVL